LASTLAFTFPQNNPKAGVQICRFVASSNASSHTNEPLNLQTLHFTETSRLAKNKRLKHANIGRFENNAMQLKHALQDAVLRSGVFIANPCQITKHVYRVCICLPEFLHYICNIVHTLPA
jgi:hypothetical protein